MDSFQKQLQAQLTELESQGLKRNPAVLESVRGTTIQVGGQSLVNWCTNDYLGLSQHPQLIQAANQAMQEWGVGGRASRLLAGTTQLHIQLEQDLAIWYAAPVALVFSSGYLANIGTLNTLLDEESIVFVDRLAHASLIDAVRSSAATMRVFRHNDMEHLQSLLDQQTGQHRIWIVTEGVFSMDGDHAPVETLLELAQKYAALLYLDDAHGAFAMGKRGRGICESLTTWPENLILMVTLGKALGCQGGAILAHQVIRENLVNHARTFIYETALAIPVVAAARCALSLADEMKQKRDQLDNLSYTLHAQLQSWGKTTLQIPSHIQPIILGGCG